MSEPTKSPERTYVTMAGKSIGKCSSGHWLPLRGNCDLCGAGPHEKCRLTPPFSPGVRGRGRVMIPAGYSKLPDGVVCKCFKLWREADGSHWCCLPVPGPAESQDDLTELVAAAIARAGFPRSRESAREYRLRLARAALREVSKYEARNDAVGSTLKG